MQEITPNQISPELAAKIPAFPAGAEATVTYRLLQTGVLLEEVDKNGVGKMTRQQSQPVTVTAQATIYDQFKQADVVLMVSKGKEQRAAPGGGIILVDKIEHITFNAMGELTVQRSQMPLYNFLELMPANKTNRVPGAPVPRNGYLFERVEVEKTEKELAERKRLAIKVKGQLADATDEELRLIGLRLKQDVTKSANGIFNDLDLLADADPEQVFNALGDQALKTQALVNESVKANVIEYVGDKQQWVATASREALLTVAQGDPTETLTNYLVGSQGQKTKAAIGRLLEEKTKKRK